VLGFVGAGGSGFRAAVGDEPVSVPTHFALLIVTSVIVIAAERLSALLRARLG
jgi:ABC-type phosphate/phosphonate transport system permease subunit